MPKFSLEKRPGGKKIPDKNNVEKVNTAIQNMYV